MGLWIRLGYKPNWGHSSPVLLSIAELVNSCQLCPNGLPTCTPHLVCDSSLNRPCLWHSEIKFFSAYLEHLHLISTWISALASSPTPLFAVQVQVPASCLRTFCNSSERPSWVLCPDGKSPVCKKGGKELSQNESSNL